MALLGRLYSRRIINVNVNIVLAGLLALGPAAAAAHLTHYIGVHHPVAITTITLVADAIADVLIYYVLHWVANHYPKRHRGQWGAVDLGFIRDASLVQFERALLIPIFYGVTAGFSWYFLHHEVFTREWATVVALIIGIAVTRFVHTGWMLRQERRKTRRAEPNSPTAVVPSTPASTAGDPPAPAEPSPTAQAPRERIGL